YPPGGGEPAQSEDHRCVGQAASRAGGVRADGGRALLRAVGCPACRADAVLDPEPLQSLPLRVAAGCRSGQLEDRAAGEAEASRARLTALAPRPRARL